MSSHCYSVIFLPLLIISVAGRSSPEHHDLVEKSCVHASYPDLCLRTLSTYGGASASTPRELAQVAVRVSLAHVRQASDFLSDLKAGGRRERSALTDCVEQMADSVEELSRTLAALRRLRRGAEFRWQMSNAETWVSAALTNEDTCLDGFREIGGKVRSDVHRKITNVARVTSNALYLINLLDE
ncbi:plant invertase/pectin methylesterase inhibitor [Striga asiatica]|uniref:Plant invertase/pectin methylesterase inhibitor n=1 Tax=Striga asiatica TaxID=4170 RepID=A0A5A7Q5T2_STRAF|nr:plant invertase/pectin methylesterase inhibitor [Striga asiatica]